MALAFSNLPKMARLLDEVWDFTPAEFEVWRDAQPEVDHSVCAELERMLKARPGESWQDFLREGPRLHPPSASEENPCRAGDLVGAYRLLREIGRGGMAVVWLGERADGTVKRPVAIKMPLLTVTVSAEADRFSRERDVLAILEHPQIARLYDAGVTLSGRPFIVLEYVDGCPITQACDLRKMGVASRLRMFLQVLQAVEIAHKHLIVHRDIKPSNVFVDAQNRVKLLDFGIAKLLDASFEGASLQTVEGTGALTPLYAAPEQIGGGVISTATDIYALGVLLYELVTGTLPHAIEGTIADVVQAALHREPIRPSLANMPPAAAAERDAADSACLRSSLSGDLDTIILKALRKSPADRYGTIGHFIDDVERFLADRPIAARPPSFAYVSRLFIKRHRAVAFAAMIGTACALVVGSVALREYFDSVEQRLRGDAVRDFMLDMVEDAEPDEAHADAEPTGRQMIERAVKRAREDFADQPRLRGELLAALGRVRGRLDEDNAGTPLIEEALVLLEANAPASDPELNKARARVAERALNSGHLDRARDLAQRSLTLCTDGRECAKARLYSIMVLAHIESLKGQALKTIDYMHQAVQESKVAFGPEDKETALVLMTLARTERSGGQLYVARNDMDLAVAMAQHANMRADDRRQMAITQATLSLDLGDYGKARDSFSALLPAVKDKAESAQILRYLSTAQLALGDVSAALDRASLALQAGTAVRDQREILLDHLAHARAMSLAGFSQESIMEIESVIEQFVAAGYQPAAIDVFRARRDLAEASMRSGNLETGLQQLRALPELGTVPKVGQEVELAVTFDLIGCALRDTGRPKEALAWHLKSAGLLDDRLEATHPIRLRNMLYQLAATWRLYLADDSVQASFKQALASYLERFPPKSIWRTLSSGANLGSPCDEQQKTNCNFIL